MALFDKPFSQVPEDDIAERGSGSDVAVVDTVPAPPSAAAPLESAVAAGSADPRTITSTPAPPAPVPPARVDVPVAATPAATASAPSRLAAAPASASGADPGVALVPHEAHGLQSASEPAGLVAFVRSIPEPNPQPRRDTQRLISAIDESEPVLDQLRSLAASLHQARSGRELKVIAVTSSVSGEGKTLLAANLALTLSKSYMRQVLLIDADLRRPSLHRLFGIPSQDGIHTALESVVEGAPVVVQEVAPRLALLPGGKPVRDPISVLASDAMQRLMTAAMATYDWIVVDTPPVGMLPDVSLLSSLADAVLLVVESGRVRYDLVQRTVESIGAERIFGVVLNKVPERDIVAAYGMHYYAPYR